jgi:hypothetical protein
MNVVSREGARITVRPRGNTAALPKGKKLTVKMKIDAGMV